MVCVSSKGLDQPTHTRSLNRAFSCRLNILYISVKPLTEHILKFLSLKGGGSGSSESTSVKMPHCWKSHVTAHLFCSELDKNGTNRKMNYTLQMTNYSGMFHLTKITPDINTFLMVFNN